MISTSFRAAGVLAVAGLLAFGACSDDEGEQDTTERNEEGQIEQEGEVGVFAFTEGDCLLLPDSDEPQASYDAVPCDEAHDVQVFALFDVDGDDDDDYPGQSVVQAEARERCEGEEWDEIFDVAYAEDPDHGVSSLYPSEGTWGEGDREVVCVVGMIDGSQLTEDLVN